MKKDITSMIQKGGGSNYVDDDIKNMKKLIELNNEKLYNAKIVIEDFREKLNCGNIDMESDSSSDESVDVKPKKSS